MKNSRNVIAVAPNHIGAGISKYKGEIDSNLHSLIKFAGLNYTPYIFNDGRILLVLPENAGAFLYSDKEMLFKIISLE